VKRSLDLGAVPLLLTMGICANAHKNRHGAAIRTRRLKACTYFRTCGLLSSKGGIPARSETLAVATTTISA